MKRDERSQRSIEELLEHSLPSASNEQIEAGRERILNYVQSDEAVEREDLIGEADFWPSRAFGWRRNAVFAAAALLVLVTVWIGVAWQSRGVYALLKTPKGSLYRVAKGGNALVGAGDRIQANEVVRSSDDAGALLALADGSRVEIRSKSELLLEPAYDGVRIRLNKGSVLVNAAKQHNGHLYVQTKDVTVAVIGTVFLVNAEEEGSRVAVIEGEVRVKQGATETSLRRGEQVTTNPKIEAPLVSKGTEWSPEASAYLSKLQEATAQSLAARQSAGPTTSVSDKPQFEEASIRLCEQEIPSAGGRGGGGNGSIRISPGRVDVACMTVNTLISLARPSLNNNPRRFPANGILTMNTTPSLPPEVDQTRVRRGPDWVRSEKYTIAAVGGSTDAATLQGPMLMDLLERRFNLKWRVETEEIPVYALSIAKGGLKIKPIESVKYEELRKVRAQPGPGHITRGGAPLLAPTLADSLGCSPPPRGPIDAPRDEQYRFFEVFLEALRRNGQPPGCGFDQYRNGPNRVISSGASPISLLVDSLNGKGIAGPGPGTPYLADTLNRLLVVDKTGLPDTDCLDIPSAGTRCAPLFNYFLEFAIDESYFTMKPRITVDFSIPKAPNIFAALERLGLHLEKTKVPREFIVIEHIERPSPN